MDRIHRSGPIDLMGLDRIGLDMDMVMDKVMDMDMDMDVMWCIGVGTPFLFWEPGAFFPFFFG